MYISQLFVCFFSFRATRARLDPLGLLVPQVLPVPEDPLGIQARMGPVALLESR